MKLPGALGHLTYRTRVRCTGSKGALARDLAHVSAIGRRVAGCLPFGVGLRVTASGVRALSVPEALFRFRVALETRRLYAFTVDGTIYGPLNRSRPDWLDDDRLRYSDGLAELLATLLPSENVEGSITTIPLCDRHRLGAREDFERMADRLVAHAASLVRIRERTGRTIRLGLEPAPGGALETTADAVAFLEDYAYARRAGAMIAMAAGLPAPRCEEALRRHLGLCIDACHVAVEFEDPGAAIELARRRGIVIAKLRLGAALRVVEPSARALAALVPFAEPSRRHPVVAQRGPLFARYEDLDEALWRALPEATADREWRVLTHMPLYRERVGPELFRTTRAVAASFLTLQAHAPFTAHLEVEPAPNDLGPTPLRRRAIGDGVVRELQWVRAQLAQARPRALSA